MLYSNGSSSIFPPSTQTPTFLLLPGHLNVCAYVYSVVSDSLRPMDCSPPGSSVLGILQARILEQVGISYSRGSSQPRDQTCFVSPALAGGFFTTSTTWEGRSSNRVCLFDFPLKRRRVSFNQREGGRRKGGWRGESENESNRKTGREKWEGHINRYLVLEEVFVV